MSVDSQIDAHLEDFATIVRAALTTSNRAAKLVCIRHLCAKADALADLAGLTGDQLPPDEIDDH